MMVLMRAAAAIVLLAFTLAGAGADEVDAINAMFRNIEKAHASRDLELLANHCYGDSALFVVETSSRAFAMEAAQALKATKNQVWDVAGLEWRKTTNRRIVVRNDLAFIRLTVTDHYKGGKTESSEQFVILAKTSSRWKVCFSMPALVSPLIAVTSVEPGSAAAEAQLMAGDLIVACDDEAVDPALFGIDCRELVRRRGTSEVKLTVERSGSLTEVRVPSGLDGASLEAVLRPLGSARVVGPDESHPVKDLLAKEIAILKEGTAGEYAGILCPSGFFSYRRAPGQPTSLVAVGSAGETMRKQLAESRSVLDPASISLEGVCVIATPNLALGVASISANERSGTRLRIPTRLHVYMRDGAEWRLVADLVQRFRCEEHR